MRPTDPHAYNHASTTKPAAWQFMLINLYVHSRSGQLTINTEDS